MLSVNAAQCVHLHQYADITHYWHFVTPKEEVLLGLSDVRFLVSFSKVMVQTNQHEMHTTRWGGWLKLMVSLKN